MNIFNVFAMLFFFIFSIFVAQFSKKIYGGKVVNPINVFIIPIILSIISYNLKLLPYINLSIISYIVILETFFIFFVGTIIGKMFFKKNSNEYIKRMKQFEENEINKMFYVTSVLSLTGFFYRSYITLNTYNIYELIANLWKMELIFQKGIFGYLNLLNVLIPSLFVLKERKKKKDIFILFFSIMGLLFSGIKAYIVEMLGILFFVISIEENIKTIFKRMIVIFIIMVLFFSFYKNFIDIFTINYEQTFFNKYIRPFYSYFTCGIPGIEVAIFKLYDWKLPFKGYIIFRPILRQYYNIISTIDFSEPLPFSSIGKNLQTNVYSFVGETFIDAGLFGTLLTSFIVGVIASYLWFKYISRKKRIDKLILCVYLYFIGLSFFMFNNITSVAYIFAYTLFLKIIFNLKNYTAPLKDWTHLRDSGKVNYNYGGEGS